MHRIVPTLLLALSPFTRMQAQAPPTSWWPDPANGIMWTGGEVDWKHRHNYQQAVGTCSKLDAAGYSTGWRLPSLDEVQSNTIPRSRDITDIDMHLKSGHAATYVDKGTFEGTALKFNEYFRASIWTSTPAGPGLVYAVDWEAPYKTASKLTDEGTVASGGIATQVYCVRPMEPELLALAKQARPSAEVNGISQLQSIAFLVTSENFANEDKFADAIPPANQALLLDAKSLRALHDLGIAQFYLGQWDDAIASFSREHAINTGDTDGIFQLKLAKAVKKIATADNKTLHAWVLLHDASVQQTNGKYQDAVALANQVILMEPTWPQGYDSLGNAQVHLGMLDEGIASLEKAASLDKEKLTYAKSELANAKDAQKAGKMR